MILTPHILVGAAIGSKFSSPAITFLLALASHYLTDSIPHWEYLRFKKDNKNNKKIIKGGIIKIILDSGLGLLLIFLLSPYPLWHLPLFVGILGALLPDGISLAKTYFPNKFFFSLHRIHWFFHSKIKPAPFPWGLGIQIIISIAGLLVITF